MSHLTLRALTATFRGCSVPVAWVLGTIALVAIHAVLPTGPVGQVTYVACTGISAALALLAARRMPPGVAQPWRWVALGLVSSAIADAYWGIYSVIGTAVPAVSLADPAWMLSYVFLIAGMFMLLRDKGDGVREDVEGRIDTAVAVVVSVLVLWHLVVQPVLRDASISPLTQLVWASYPVLDAVLLALVIRTVISGRAGTIVGRLLVAGTTCWLLCDLATNLWESIGITLVLLDTGWMVGGAVVGMAAWVAADDAAAAPSPVAERPPADISAWMMGMAFLPLLVPAGLEVLSHRRGGDPVMLLAGTGVLAALAYARSMSLLHRRRDAESRVRSSERYYRALAANAADAVVVLDAHGQITNESSQLAAILGHPGQSIRGIRALSAVSVADTATAADVFQRVLAAPGKVFDRELRVQAADGREPWLAVRAVNLLDDPDVAGIVVNFHEISDRKVAEGELVHLAFHDSLTGLANRSLFHDRVQHALEASRRPSAAVVFLDLDGFKNVNDGLGHEAGDDLLRQVAIRLQRAARAGDTVARLGGDEFALLLEDDQDPGTAAAAIADRILRELTEPVLLAGGPVTLSASIGIATADGGATASSLLRDADVAMYQAKAAGRGRWVRYVAEMRTLGVERLQLRQDLAVALDDGQLRVEYQPVVDLASGAIVGLEALLRWDHPTLGRIVPDRFVPLAEESGLIIAMGRWVLLTACQAAASWRAEHPSHQDLTIAVNVSARQLASSDLVSHVEEALAASGLPAEALVLEMTETALVNDPTTAAGRLRQLRRLGLRLAIDDFGTGYSSLSYLRQFPVDILKIDQSFVSSMAATEAVPPLVHGLLELGHTLGLEMVAEGIETEGQLCHLRAERCQLGQGYLFARPMPADEVSALLRRTDRRRHPAGLPGRDRELVI